MHPLPEAVLLPVEIDQPPAITPDPDIPRRILGKTVDIIIGEGSRLPGLVAVLRKLKIILVIIAEPVLEGTQPHSTHIIPEQGSNTVRRNALGIVVHMADEFHREIPLVYNVDPAMVRSQPDPPVAVLQSRKDHIDRKSTRLNSS